MAERQINRRQALKVTGAAAVAGALAACDKKQEQSEPKDGKSSKTVRLNLDAIDVDELGRVVINDPKLASAIEKARASGAEAVYLGANSGNYCVLPSGCPVTGQNVGCGCPTIPKKPKK